LDPPDFVSPDVPVDGLVVSLDGFLASSLFVAPPSPDSVFAGDFVSLALEAESLDEAFFEP
jgi:hypothetical protein